MFEKERMQLIAMAGVAISMSWTEEANKICQPDSPRIASACVEFAQYYVFPCEKGKIRTDVVHNNVFAWAEKYVKSLK